MTTQIKHDCCVKLVTFAGQNSLPCKALHWTIGHQAIHTSLWLSVSLRIPLSIACSWKKRFVHVRIHYSVRKILINVVTSLWLCRCWFSFLAWSTFPILLQQVRNSTTRERSLYKTNDIKYESGINPTTSSIWTGKGFALSAYIIKKIVKPNKTKAKPSIVLK